MSTSLTEKFLFRLQNLVSREAPGGVAGFQRPLQRVLWLGWPLWLWPSCHVDAAAKRFAGHEQRIFREVECEGSDLFHLQESDARHARPTKHQVPRRPFPDSQNRTEGTASGM